MIPVFFGLFSAVILVCSNAVTNETAATTVMVQYGDREFDLKINTLSYIASLCRLAVNKLPYDDNYILAKFVF